MRTSYLIPTSKEFDILFQDRTRIVGGSLSDIQTFKSPIYYQRGSGIFSVLGSIARRSLPFLRKYILPAAGELIYGLSNDVSERKNIKDSIKRRSMEAIKKIGTRVYKGGRARRNRKPVKKIRKKKKKKNTRRPPYIAKAKKCHTNDVFDI